MDQAHRALQAIDALLDVLGRELAAGDLDAGWTEEMRTRWLSRMRVIRTEVAAGVKPSVILEVALDHNGIHGPFDRVRTPLSWHVDQLPQALHDWR